MPRWSTPRIRFAAAFAYACAAVATSVWFLRDAFVPNLVAALRSGGGDCVINWLGARAWFAGRDIYSAAGLKWAGLTVFGHPPTTPLWYLPVARYDIYGLTQIYGHLLLFMLLVHLVLAAAELRAPVALATGLLAWALVMDTQWWVYHVTMLQLSEPIALLYVLAWLCLRRDHEIGCGILIGLACSMKLYAGLVVLLLLVGKRWRGAVAAIVVYLGFAVAATWGFGLACWREYLPMLQSTQREVVGRGANASLQGILVRAWPASSPHGASVSTAMLVGTLLSVVVIAGLSWISRRAVVAKRTSGIDEDVDLPFALFTVGSVWLNPVAWEHYNVTLLMPMGVALFAVWRQAGRARITWIALTTALLCFVAYLLSIDMYAKTNATTPAQLRWYVTANWLPWPIVLGILATLMWRREKLSAATGARPA